MGELKKCPFCKPENVRLMCFDGQEAHCIDSEDELDKKGYCPYIHCYGCDIDFCPDTTTTPREAIKKWNRRRCD